MDIFVGGLIVIGVPLLLFYLIVRGGPQKAYNKRVKRAQEHMLFGQVDGMVVRDAIKRSYPEGR